MRKLMLLAGMVSAPIHAGVINQVEVRNNTVLFSTTSIADSNLPCTLVDNKKLRAFSLNTHDGRAMYSLIVTALSKNYAIETVSAQDCADTLGVERVQTLRLVADVSKKADASGGIGVYKNDGVTRLGTYVKHGSSSYGKMWEYIDKSASDDFKQVNISFHGSKTIYFTGLGCTGEELLGESNIYYSYNHRTFVKGDSSVIVEAASYKTANSNSCDKHDARASKIKVYPLIKVEHPVCGAGFCKIRED
ncbi:hypothetical protein PSECIP111854_01104 [Pseudoalteromonas sp. CIP111854]|uniref:Uncharacterized protein n=1 Tax=Pseudoalteromonas holothuriae TaxID=2963714 RepID=A0A9W4W201_9GAMM|nr:hypothetical protein [Pseudoalteromonas sp. CIP111854]CAH9053105.1 hypothetical protein PSECIP111854_01104 [Pseudoalteromonas sp. CIP111854]